MKKENISILKVKIDKLYQHPCFSQKKWKSIAEIQFRFYEGSIYCQLIEAICKKTGEKFNFIELPCQRFKNKLGKWSQNYLFYFKSKEESDQFQMISKELLNESHPFLMKNPEEVIISEEDNNIKKSKARNTSKFL